MTKREPLFTREYFGVRVRGGRWINFKHAFAEAAINDAHEARVNEEVRKAVEEFRERAANICSDHYFDSLEGKGHGEALAAMIRALPTEPEEK